MQTATRQPEQCAESLKALSDPTRLQIIEHLRAGPLNVGELAAAVDTTVVTISHHLGILYHAGFVRRTKQGRFVVYSLDKEVFIRSSRGAELIDLQCCRIEMSK
ncbi:MAG TPA: metalloregulator ArsR/SmtB family transcription factor [Planctomycetaceae bacterium]|nr:metalloregulator ArsR/SmtB family transcription factor [Planctomycetaceae bacterium]